jgi:excisionase family DNA binding protein
MPAGSRQLLTAAEVADYLQVHRRTVRDWLAAGEIPATLVDGAWRVRVEDLEAWVESRRIPPGRARSGPFSR